MATGRRGDANVRSVHDRRTPRTVLDGRIWVGWGSGPPVGGAGDEPSPALEVCVARATGRDPRQVRDVLALGQDGRRYILLERLSVTEHAAVFLAVDRSLAREVAVKIHRDAEKHARDRAVFESQTAARLDHPNIVKIFDVGEHSPDGHTAWLFSAFERCDCDLFQYCEEHREWESIVAAHIQVGRGLIHMHEAGYVHRDLKPPNILIKDGVAKLADFGTVARPGADVEPAGTAGFIAPETIIERPSFSADLFGLAATLWACLHLELPFAVPSGPNVTRENALAVAVQRAIDREFTAPRVIPPGLPTAVRRLLVRALEPDPRLRPSLGEFLDELQFALDRAERRKRLRRWSPAIAGAVLVTLGVGVAIGAAIDSGSGQTSIDDAMLGGDPLIRAEIAALMGDGKTAIRILYEGYSRLNTLSRSERARLAEAAGDVAGILEKAGLREDADLAAGLAKVLRGMSD